MPIFVEIFVHSSSSLLLHALLSLSKRETVTSLSLSVSEMSPQKEQNVLDKPSRILKHLYLGSKVHAKDKVLLKKLNITHVVNCSPPRR